MTDESSRINQQKNLLAVIFLGLFAVLSGTAELARDREHSLPASCLYLLIFVGLALLAGSLARYIKAWKAFPQQSASSDIKMGLRILLILFPVMLSVGFLLRIGLWDMILVNGFLLSFGLFSLGRGLYTRSLGGAVVSEPETPAPTPPGDE